MNSNNRKYKYQIKIFMGFYKGKQKNKNYKKNIEK